MSFNNLSSDHYYSIFGYLNYQDLWAMRVTSSKFKDLLNTNRFKVLCRLTIDREVQVVIDLIESRTLGVQFNDPKFINFNGSGSDNDQMENHFVIMSLTEVMPLTGYTENEYIVYEHIKHSLDIHIDPIYNYKISNYGKYNIYNYIDPYVSPHETKYCTINDLRNAVRELICSRWLIIVDRYILGYITICQGTELMIKRISC